MSFFSEASLAMIPSGYKTSKVYSALPTSGDGDLTFTRSNDTATRVGPNGYIEKVRTNLFSYSEQFDNAYWTKYGSTITTNTSETTDPLGGNAADIIVSANATGACGTEGDIAYTSGVETTISLYAKYKNTSFIQMLAPSFVTTEYVNFNIQTGAIVGGSYAYTPTITSVGNGWYRCSFTFVSGYTGTTAASPTFLVDAAASTRGQAFTGDGVKAVYIFGAQVEYGVMTDYIATTSAAVTVGPVANVPRLDYLDSSSPRLLLEPQRTNLALYSEQINNAYWTAAGASITANTAVAPDGATSMDRLTETATTNPHQVISTAVTIFGGVARVFSAFVKKGNVRYIQLANVAFGDSSASSIFDLDTKTVTDSRASSGAGPTFSFVSASVEDYGNGILRLILVNTSSFDSPTYRIAHSNQATFTGATLVDGMVSYAGDASSFTDIWGAQVEAGSYATSYIPTLGASVTRGADAASKTGISSLIGQTEGTIFAEINFDLGVTAQGDSRIQLSDGTASNWIFIGLPDGASGNLIRMYVNTPSSAMTAYSTNPVVNGVNKIAFGYKSGSFVLYVNGVQAATSSTTLTMAACSRIDLQGSVPAESAQERTNYKQLLLFTSRLSNDDLASLTTI
jgi:hypothetical protein